MKLLFDFLRLRAIVGAVPNNILDGQIIDAIPVMANFNWIVSQVNSNVPPLIPSIGTGLTFVAAASVGGSANNVTIAPTPAIVAYAAGQMFRFVAKSTNTGAVTIATSGLAPRGLTYQDGTTLSGQEIIINGVYDIIDNGTNYILLDSAQGSNIQAFVPSIDFGGGTTGITYGSQLGNWYKANRMLYFTLLVTLTNKGSSTGIAHINGLPFPVNASWGFNNSTAVFADNVTFAGNYLMFSFNSGSSQLTIANIATGAAHTTLTDTAFANNTTIACGGFYAV